MLGKFMDLPVVVKHGKFELEDLEAGDWQAMNDELYQTHLANMCNEVVDCSIKA